MELLQTATTSFITKCDGIITNCDSSVDSKVRGNYYKLRQLRLLQSAMELLHFATAYSLLHNAVELFQIATG